MQRIKLSKAHLFTIIKRGEIFQQSTTFTAYVEGIELQLSVDILI